MSLVSPSGQPLNGEVPKIILPGQDPEETVTVPRHEYEALILNFITITESRDAFMQWVREGIPLMNRVITYAKEHPDARESVQPLLVWYKKVVQDPKREQQQNQSD